MDNQNTRRVFFALWPDDDVRQQIVEVFKQSPQSKLHGRKMRPENIHVTLHFIGNVSEEKLHCLDQMAQTVTTESFELVLDCYGYFKKSRVFWMGCSGIPDGLIKLYGDLGRALVQCDYRSEPRPYAPHLTLMRKLNHPGELEDFTPVQWTVNEFALIESVSISDGVRYEVIRRYKCSIS